MTHCRKFGLAIAIFISISSIFEVDANPTDQLIASVNPTQSDPAQSDNVDGKLRMTNGDVYAGTIDTSRPGDALLWISPGFSAPLTFPWETVESIDRPIDRDAATKTVISDSHNLHCVEFTNGQALSGRISNIDSQSITLDGPVIGSIRIPVESVRTVLRLVASDKNYSNVGLVPDNWSQVIPAFKNGRGKKWFSRAGAISTDSSGTTISQSADLPESAAIDLHVTWEQSSPNWWLTVGEPKGLELQVRKMQNKKQLKISFTVEDASTADVVSIQVPDEESKSISFRILCDSRTGRYVLIYRGEAIADLKIDNAKQLLGNCQFRFTNTAIGTVTLRDLRISRQVSSMPKMLGSETSQAEILVREGKSIPSIPLDFDQSSQTIGFHDSQGAINRIPLSEIDRIDYPIPSVPTVEKDSVQSTVSFLVNVELRTGERYVGQAIRSNQDSVILSVEGIDSGLSLPIESISRIARTRNTAMARMESTPPQTGDVSPGDSSEKPTDDTTVQTQFRLVTSNVLSTGYISGVSLDANSHKNALSWHPVGAVESVPIALTSSGFIEPLKPSTGRSKSDRRKPASELSGAPTASNEPTYGRTLRSYEPALFLKNGDCFPAVIEGIDENEVRFKSSFFKTNLISSNLVRGIRLLAYSGSDAMAKEIRKRILTLPRMQRTNPPTHIVLSRDGDLVRGRLIRSDIDRLTIDVRGVEKVLLTKNIAEIVWLQEAAPMPASELETTSNVEDTNYQVHLESGTRISINPISRTTAQLVGIHPQLGECELDWTKITRMSLGNDLAAEMNSRFAKWKLQNAPDPKFVNDADSADQASGDQNTPQQKLVGREAPDFELKTLAGESVRLSQMKGQIVILDFWATWCGPCVASLPKLVELSSEFKSGSVQLLAVNLEQSEADVRKFLAKLDIEPRVVLDTDGSVAQQYRVEAIPQTVIIDRDGTVKEVIVGSGSEDRVRNLLESMLHLKL